MRKNTFVCKVVIGLLIIGVGTYIALGSSKISSSVRSGITKALFWDMELKEPINTARELLGLPQEQGPVNVDAGAVCFMPAAAATVINDFAACGKTVYKCGWRRSVCAVCAGTVSSISTDKNGLYTFSLTNSAGQCFVYYGCAQVFVAKNAAVSAGELLALPEKDGTFSLAMYVDGVPCNPADYIPEAPQ